MISEKDKQAILNGAYGVTRRGRKVKYLGCNNGELDHYPYKFIKYNENNQMDNKLLNLKFSKTRGFYANPIDNSLNDIVGLWEDEPEPFDLERALNGEPVLLRNGLKAEVFKALENPDAAGFQYFGLSHQCNDDGIWYHDQKWNKNLQATRIPDDQEHNYDIVGMWKEPEPLSSNSLQLPKPISHFENAEHLVYMLSADVTGKFKAKEVEAFERNLSMLINGRYYNAKQDVIKVIETITGKSYEE